MERRDFLKYGVLFTGACCAGGFLLKNLNFNKGNEYNSVASDGQITCSRPFDSLEIHFGGNVFSCCPDYHLLGNVNENSLIEIWNGKKYQDIRERMLKCDYSKCKHPFLKCGFDNPVNINELKGFDSKVNYPRYLHLCYDMECDYNCITCRDEIYTNTEADIKMYDKMLPDLLKLINKAEFIHFSGGDAFASVYTRNLLKEINQKYNNFLLSVHTNGYHCDKKNFEELGIKKLDLVGLSINATNRETYKKIMRKDAFDRIINNLGFLKEMKEQGNIGTILIKMVVHSLNYEEMPAFVKLGKKYNAQVLFIPYEPWDTAEMYKRYKEVAVFDPSNKDFPKFKKMLKDPIFKDSACILPYNFIDILNS